MFYHAKLLAIQFHLESNIHKLPIDPMKVECESCKWRIFHYSSEVAIRILTRLKLLHLKEEYYAFTLCTPEGEYIIFYSPKLSYVDRCYYIAHEIGHIYLGHAVSNYVVGKSDSPATNNAQEHEANEFARYLIAPECVLLDLNITEPDDISKYTGLSHENASYTAYAINKIEKLVDSEIALCERFRPNKNIKKGIINRIAIGATLVSLIIAFGTFTMPDKRAVDDDKTILITEQNVDVSAKLLEYPEYSEDEVCKETAVENSTYVRPKQEMQASTEKNVYAISYDHKYHRKSCKWIKGYDNLLEMPLEKAIEIMGSDDACKDCNPLED